MKISRLLLLFFLIISCSEDKQEPQADAASVKYVNDVIDVMEENFIGRDTTDWTKFRRDVLSKVMTPADVRNAIAYALTGLRDNQSNLASPGVAVLYGTRKLCSSPDLIGSTPQEDIAKVWLLRNIEDEKSDQEYVDKMQNYIHELDDMNLVGWIVDLRNTKDGSPWAYLAGVGPILGGGASGYLIDADKTTQAWMYKDGSAVLDGEKMVTATNPIQLFTSNPKVAVLINEGTVRPGELIAVAFKGRPNTKFFGAATCGSSTVTSAFTLSDGSTLNLTTHVMADQLFEEYGQSISPDQTTAPGDATVNAAIEWLRAH